MTFGTYDDFRTELIDFDITPIGLPYNAILGYLALARFMAATHPAYNLMKMPGSSGVLTMSGDTRDALQVLQLVFRAVAVAQPTGTDALPCTTQINRTSHQSRNLHLARSAERTRCIRTSYTGGFKGQRHKG